MTINIGHYNNFIEEDHVMLKNQKGFSLVELMIVVAIIGILAAIAIPNFQKFQEKAKQTEAKTVLSGIFTAEASYYAEFSVYTARFDSMGYASNGAAVYRAGFGANDALGVIAGAAPGTATCIQNCSAAAVPAVCAAGFVTWTCNVGAATIVGSVTPTALLYTASAGGFINNNAGAVQDQWTMNNAQLLSNTQSGL